MWSSYGDAGMLVEKKMASMESSDSTQTLSLPYVVNDIATFFTLLVGIYFPSVTGKKVFTSFLFSVFVKYTHFQQFSFFILVFILFKVGFGSTLFVIAVQ